MPEVVETDEDDNEAFRSAMDMSDQIAAFKRDAHGFELKIYWRLIYGSIKSSSTNWTLSSFLRISIKIDNVLKSLVL